LNRARRIRRERRWWPIALRVGLALIAIAVVVIVLIVVRSAPTASNGDTRGRVPATGLATTGAPSRQTVSPSATASSSATLSPSRTASPSTTARPVTSYDCTWVQAPVGITINDQADLLTAPDFMSAEVHSKGSIQQYPDPTVLAVLECPEARQTGLCPAYPHTACRSVIQYLQVRAWIDPGITVPEPERWATGYVAGFEAHGLPRYSRASHTPSSLHPVTGYGCKVVPAGPGVVIDSPAGDQAVVYNVPDWNGNPDAVAEGLVDLSKRPDILGVTNCASGDQYVLVCAWVNPGPGQRDRWVFGFVFADHVGWATGLPSYATP
jgi:hypothetical protein